MKKFGFVLFALMLVLAYCQEKPDQQASPEQIPREDSVEVEQIDTVLSDESVSLFNRIGFSEFARNRAPSFEWDKFRMVNTWRDDSLLVTPFREPKNHQLFKKLYRYSPDSTRYLDLDSYNLSIETDKQGRIVTNEAGPDTEISLVDVKGGKKTRLLFLGPGSSVEDGAWIDNENLVMMGFQETGNSDTALPVLWRYHLPTRTFYQYEMPDPVVAKQLMGEWRKQRLKTLTSAR